MMRRCVALFTCCVLVGCATPAEKSVAGGLEKQRPPATRKETRVTLSQEAGTLGDTVRRIGKETWGGLVLMNGLEDRALGPLKLRNVEFGKMAQLLADKAGCAVQQCADYYFLFPSQYEALTGLSLTGKLDPSYQDKRAVMAFGAGIPLYDVFLWLSRGTGLTVVADNAVAEARCGEVALGEVPLGVGLEAVLKSARVAQFEVDSTPEFIFIRARGNQNPKDTLLDAEALDDRQKAFLDSKVTVILPAPPADPSRLELSAGAVTLRSVLDSFSKQVGIQVVAEQELAPFPVNPAAFNQVRVRTAMDLLIRQWLLPGFGYQMTQDRIVIRRR